MGRMTYLWSGDEMAACERAFGEFTEQPQHDDPLKAAFVAGWIAARAGLDEVRDGWELRAHIDSGGSVYRKDDS